MFTLLDLCVSSLRRSHANLLCIVPILTDVPRKESTDFRFHRLLCPRVRSGGCQEIRGCVGRRRLSRLQHQCPRLGGGTKNSLLFSIGACHPLRRGHANLLCIVPSLTDNPRKESNGISKFYVDSASMYFVRKASCACHGVIFISMKISCVRWKLFLPGRHAKPHTHTDRQTHTRGAT